MEALIIQKAQNDLTLVWKQKGTSGKQQDATISTLTAVLLQS